MNKFKQFFISIYHHIFLFLSMIVFFALIPYLIVALFIKPICDTYNVDFTSSTIIVNYEEMTSYDALQKTKNEIIAYRESIINEGKTAPYSDFSYVDISKMSKKNHISISLENDIYTLSVSEKYFNSLAQARRFLKALASNEEYTESVNFFDPICYANEINSYLVLGISSSSALAISLLIFGLIFIFKNDLLIDRLNYDNEKIYKTPFHLSYIKSSLKEVKTVKKMVLLAVLFALQLSVKLIPIPSGFSNLGIGLAYLVFAVIGMIYGPFVGMLIGMSSDILGYIIKPDGVFFLGYTLSAMLAGLAYGLCFYKTKITFTKCLFARIIVNFPINTLLGSYWWWIVSEKSFSLKTYILITSLPKNLVYLIPQALFLYYFIKVLSRALKYSNIINRDICDNISII